MAKQDLGKIVPTFNGIYNANIVYEKLCIVNYKGSVYVSKKDIPKGTDISNEECWYLLIEKLKKGVDYFTEEDRKAIIDEVTKLAESDFNKYYDEKKKALDKVASDNTTAFLKVVKDNTTDFNSNVDTQTKAFDTHYDEKVKSFDENSDKQTKAYDTNANKKLNDYNENHKTKMQELDDEATVKIAEYDKHSEELRNMAISTDNELERVKNEILDTGSASDSFIHVEDSCMAKIKELEIDGVCEQEITIGKNLLNVAKNLHQIKNDSYSITPVYSNGMLKYIELNGTFDKWVRYSILGAEFTLLSGTYTQSFHKTGTFSNGSVYIDSSLLITSIESDNFSKVLSDDLNILKYNICVNTGTICNNLKLYPMVAKEGKASNYEPFTNGASPNPDYPQEIKTITDGLKVTSCGKNLFDMNKFRKSTTGQGITSVIDGTSIICNGTAITTYATILVPLAKNIKFYPGQYTMSMANSLPYNMAIQTERLNGSRGADLVLNSGKTSQIINITEILIVNSVFLSFRAARPTLTNFTISDIQIEQANTSSEYEPYVESLITAKLPEGEFIGKIDDTHKDILRAEYFPEKGQYHLVLDKKVGKYVFTGNENIVLFSSVNDINQYYYILNTCLSITNQQLNNIYVISNYFQGVEWQNSWTKNNTITIGSNKRLFIYSKEFTSIDDLKNFLSTNAVEVYYPLKTPYTLDLCTIDMPLAYKKVTNIFTDSDLLPKITAKYYRTFQTTIQNLQINDKTLKQEITDLNNSISDISKRLEALESANVNTVEESEASNDLQN